jgi:sialic acid synthase SpsE
MIPDAGMKSPVHIIAEAGTNHNGSLVKGKALTDLASKAKADSIKYQMIDPDHLYLPGQYQFGTYDINKVRDMRRRFMLTDAVYAQLAEYANDCGLSFSASIFDEQGLNLLSTLNPPYIKIASTDLNNVRLLRKVAEKGIRLILSTGMSTMKDIEYSVAEIHRTGFSDITLMHCISVYPAKLEEMNLSFIDTLRSNFDLPVALSDHTETSNAACLALTKEVCYIEKHFTYDRNAEGFDHAFASENGDFVKYVSDIRASEATLNTATEKISASERQTRKRARRSLYAARDLPAGEIIEDHDVLILRPENTMSANQIDEIVGKRLKKGIRQYHAFSEDIFA